MFVRVCSLASRLPPPLLLRLRLRHRRPLVHRERRPSAVTRGQNLCRLTHRRRSRPRPRTPRSRSRRRRRRATTTRSPERGTTSRRTRPRRGDPSPGRPVGASTTPPSTSRTCPTRSTASTPFLSSCLTPARGASWRAAGRRRRRLHHPCLVRRRERRSLAATRGQNPRPPSRGRRTCPHLRIAALSRYPS